MNSLNKFPQGSLPVLWLSSISTRLCSMIHALFAGCALPRTCPPGFLLNVPYGVVTEEMPIAPDFLESIGFQSSNYCGLRELLRKAQLVRCPLYCSLRQMKAVIMKRIGD